MTGTGLFVVVRLDSEGGVVYFGAGTEDEAKAALTALEASDVPPEGVTYQWGIAELQNPPDGVTLDPTARWVAWGSIGGDDEPETRVVRGPVAEAEGEACIVGWNDEPEAPGTWREVHPVPAEMGVFPA